MIARAPGASPAIVRASPAKPQASPAKVQPSAGTVAAAVPAKPATAVAGMPAARTMRLTRVEGPAPEPHSQLPLGPDDSTRGLKMPLETAFVKIADGFDFPVGKPDAQGYYKARGFRSHGHLGEDWDGIRGGDTD